ncbi:MAG: hypothetical protein ACFE9R_15130, partial [Candidatus Hermodarchaeota archaeon]
MKSIKETQQQFKIELDDNLIKFTNFEEIYFPKNCIVCGDATQNHIGRDLYGAFTSRYDYKKNYYFSFPVCEKCKTNLEMKKGLKSKSGKLLLMSTILGIILSIVLYYFLFSIILSIGIMAVFFIIPFRYYKEKTRLKLNFEDYLKININKIDINSVELRFKDEQYAKSLREINFEKIKKDDSNQEEESEKIFEQNNDIEGESDNGV